MNRSKKRVLIGSPVHTKPQMLKEFLESLKRLKRDSIEIDYLFIDDNESEESGRMLHDFKRPDSQVTVFETVYEHEQRESYVCNETTHHWNGHLIQIVAGFKNIIIQKAMEQEYDYLFLIDSDLLLHPDTLQHLIGTGKDIVSTIFWTQWHPGAPELPQVWLSDNYDLHHQIRAEALSEQEIQARQAAFLHQLRQPGTFEVGGLGACTLVSRTALLAGVNFNDIKNISFPGEDRHFCIRAAVLGFPLFVDTHYPAYHIYRDSDLEGIEKYKKDNQSRITDSSNPKIDMPFIRTAKNKENQLTLSMVIKNEADHYLRAVLEEHKHYIDEAVIIDDGSTDDSVEICYETLNDIPIHLIQNPISKFSNADLRKQQWEETIKTNPDWILNLDADEMFEKQFANEVGHLINQQDIDVWCFRLYDFWDESHYREDPFWRAHLYSRPFLLRYQSHLHYEWKETPPLHCSRFPDNILELPKEVSSLRLKHFGWADQKKRLAKYQRYSTLDPEGRYGWKEQYESILEESPRLISWTE